MHIQVEPNITYKQREIILKLAQTLGFEISNIEYNPECPYPLIRTQYPVKISFSDIGLHDLIQHNFPFLSFEDFIFKMILLSKKEQELYNRLLPMPKSYFDNLINRKIEEYKLDPNSITGLVEPFRSEVLKRAK